MTRIYPRKALEDVKQTSFSSFLDLARWSSAGLVFIAHLRDPLFLGYHDIPRQDVSLVVRGWYFVTGWYYDAVVVFFVLSGFLVGGLASARASEGRFSVTDYTVDRLSRLSLPYIPTLLLTYALDRMGGAWFAGSGLYNGTQAMIARKVASANFLQHDTLKNLLLNLAMLQNFRADTLGSNSPLWSLSAEFWFYAVFGIAVVAFRRPATIKAASALLLSAIMIGLGPAFFPLLVLWCIGIACAYAPSNRVIERPVAAGLVLFGLLVASRMYSPNLEHHLGVKYIADFSTACAFGWLIASMRNVKSTFLTATAKVNNTLASFSYSLYLLHFPLMLFALGGLYECGFRGIAHGYSPTDPAGLCLYGVVLIFVYIAAYSFSLVTEHQTSRCRRLLKKHVKTAYTSLTCGRSIACRTKGLAVKADDMRA